MSGDTPTRTNRKPDRPRSSARALRRKCWDFDQPRPAAPDKRLSLSIFCKHSPISRRPRTRVGRGVWRSDSSLSSLSRTVNSCVYTRRITTTCAGLILMWPDFTVVHLNFVRFINEVVCLTRHILRRKHTIHSLLFSKSLILHVSTKLNKWFISNKLKYNKNKDNLEMTDHIWQYLCSVK